MACGSGSDGGAADADLLIWWTCPDPDVLQETYGRFRSTTLGRHLEPVWSAYGLHRPAEFNRNHIPAYVRREESIPLVVDDAQRVSSHTSRAISAASTSAVAISSA